MRLLLPADQPRAELWQFIIVTMMIIAIIYWTLTVGQALLGVFHGNGAFSLLLLLPSFSPSFLAFCFKAEKVKVALGRRSKWTKCILLPTWPGVEDQGQKDEARQGWAELCLSWEFQLPRGRTPSLFDK